MAGREDAEDQRRSNIPYSGKNPIPTISKYRNEKAAREERAQRRHQDINGTEGDEYLGEYQDDASKVAEAGNYDDGEADSQQDGDELQDTSQIDTAALDPKQRVKQMKSRRKERAEREVTDPVTHLPVVIRDFTDDALKEVEPNDPPYGSMSKTSTGLSNKNKSQEDLEEEERTIQPSHQDLTNRFPPPDFDALRQELSTITKYGVSVGLAAVFATVTAALAMDQWLRNNEQRISLLGFPVWIGIMAVTGALIWATIVAVRDWISTKVNDVFEDEVWHAQRQQIKEAAGKHEPETTAWLNSVLSAVWPLINPDLFTGLADTLEDVMQASLPKVVRMVSVDDIGQGSESVRILGVRWLPTGAAASAVTEDGELFADGQDQNNEQQGREKGQVSTRDDGATDGQGEADGLAAEEGDFVNLELSFAYRTRSSSKTLKQRTKDMHLYLAFYLLGNIKLPIWVDLQGVIGTMRMRLQLTPDPPFFALCTLTFLGQPKVNLSCVPLSKHGLNIMDVPFISKFVQSSVDAAMAEYVAPKSLTLDLKDMLAGDDFKKDTNAKGVLMINIKRGYDFKIADSSVPLVKDGGSDPYVSVGWAKFGKVVWSSRILVSNMEPHWDETCYLLVTPEELNIDERLRIQLWDSDRFTADDDLGRIEVSVKELMQSHHSNGRTWHRTDGFRALKSGDNMPGKLEWSVGYFSKTRIREDQFQKQTYDPEVRSLEQLKKKVNASCERKLRETTFKEGQSERDQDELEQQRSQELKAEQDAMIISAPPPEGYPSGIFSIQIHNIVGLELGRLNKQSAAKDAEASDEEETGDGLPSPYCTIIINHRKTFKTRTKPQNSKPFYNAGCERFIKDWRDCEVYVAVRDARIHEDDPLLGIVHLPLWEMFNERCQVMGYWPLTGGIGHGRIRISMVWRSLQLQAPPHLLGWELGTLEVQPTATSIDCPEELRSAKLKLRSDLGSAKMYIQSDKQTWKSKRGDSLTLPVRKRYSSCVSMAFKHKGVMGDDTAAFCVLWLKDLVDEEESELELPIWKGDFQRAITNCLPEPGEKIGSLKVKVTFWPGMGAGHSQWASGNDHLKDVVEVIATSRDSTDEDNMNKVAGVVDEDGSNSSSDDDDDDDDIPDGSSDSKQGPIDQMRDYKRRSKVLHRQHRGLMQWKAPRTAKWVKNKVGKVQDTVTETFDRTSKGGGLETEV